MIAIIELVALLAILIFSVHKMIVAKKSKVKNISENVSEKIEKIKELEAEKKSLEEELLVTGDLVATGKEITEYMEHLEELKNNLKEVEDNLKKHRNK